MKKTLCLLLSLVMVTSTLVFAQAATTETPTVIYSFDAVYDSASPVESAFHTNFAVEQIHTQGTGSTWMNFAIPTGQASNIGGMLFVNFTTARDYSAYDTFKLDIYTPVTMNGAGGMIQFNFMSDPAMQDGYNYNIDINHLTAGWNTVTFKKANYAAHANGANWSSIRRYRITWFNYSQITNVPFMCLDNLRGIVTTHTCTSSSGYKSDGSTHWTNCTECGKVMTQGSHSGGTATCTAAAKCSTCGASYGNKNASNHTGGTEIRNAKAATCGATGYTGDTHCKGCGAKTKTGTSIAATGKHTGGTATCIAKAKCSTCGTSYGNLNTSNHTGGTEVRNAKSATCGAAGYTGDTYCKGCGAKTKNGSTIAATGKHTGGTATCTGQKKCSVCGIAYGSTNGSNHTGGTEVRNAKAATCGVAGYSGDTYCKSCGAITAKGSTIAATGKHTGGTATCNAKAKCSTCGLAYGSVNASNHVGGTELRNESATYTGDTYCLGCSTVLTKGFVIDGSGVIHSFDAVYDSSCPVSSAFNTAVAIESSAKTEGTGSTRLGFNIPVGQDSGIGGMIFIDFATAKDLTAYQQFKLDIYTPLAMQGLGGKLQVNFVTGSTLQDGYNYFLNIANINTGWNTLTFDKNSYSAHANNASWSKINRIRITWFNEAQISREFVLLDNLRGSYAAHQHTAAGSIQYDATYHWYNCSTVGCGNLVNKGVHSGGTATCTAKAKCSTCGYSYGSVNSSNHAGGTEVRGATTAGCGSAGYTGDTYCLGCGVKTQTGTTISATSKHTGGTATCVAAAKCTVCGNSYGSVNSSNHVNTEVRNASATYSGDTWCKDCNTKLKTGTSLIAATAHAPYAVGRDLMINNAESLDGWSPDMFNTSLNKGSQIAQGSGSVIFNAKVPVGQSSNIGAMTKVSFPAVDLSSYGTIRYKIHFSHALSGTHQFQTNLITGNGGDGYNHVFTFTDFKAGWHTFEFKISDFSAAAAADLKSINAIRFTWFNLPQMNTQVTFTIDEVMALAPIGHAPYKVGNDLMINNADSTDGWIPDMFNTKIVAGAYKTEGNGSVSMNSTIPVGQSSSIGAMTKVIFPATDLSSYDKIRFKMHVSHKLTNAHQIQINFITGDGGDGYNHIITVADLAAGWHTVTIDRASIPQAVAANWSSINAIRFTWFNSEQITSKVEFIFDEIMAFVESDHSHTPTGSIKYDATNHWYDCAVIGCGNLVNMAPHSGGTATCVAAAKCSTCGYVYTGLNTNNHTGGTEVRDAKAATCAATGYTGDTYCKGCGAKTKTGSTIPVTGEHKNTEIRDASATYTGDTWCKDCNTKIATGSAITIANAHAPYAVGRDLMINNADSTTGWMPDMFNTKIVAGAYKTEGNGSVSMNSNVPVGQDSNIGAMTKVVFPATNLSSYGSIRYKIHFSHALTGTHQFQTNLITGDGGDGYNHVFTFTDFTAGWHTFEFKISDFSAAAAADLKSINAIRFTWFNLPQMNTKVEFVIDEIMALAPIGHTPYKVGDDLMINNADSINGWIPDMFNTKIVAGAYKTEGNGSVSMNSTIPVGQSSSIGAMTKVVFPATDLSSYDKIRFKMHVSHKLTNAHQIQINFITGDGGDGYNHIITVADLAAGWHTVTIDRASIPQAVAANWSSINAIRFTWFNSEQISDKVEFIFDEIMAFVESDHSHTPTGSIKYDATNHWYDCATIGCGVLVNQEPHSGGTATCNAKAKCSTCGYSYGSVNSSNHTGGTEVRNASSTYTGDTYCLGCSAKISTGYSIGGSGVIFPFDEVYNSNYPVTSAFNANVAIESSAKTEGTGSTRLGFSNPTGQTGGIGGMLFVDFATAKDLTAYQQFKIDVYTPLSMQGVGGFLQINFISDSALQDGYNYNVSISNIVTGWNTLTFDKNSFVTHANSADWASIKRIRITWYNEAQISREFLLLDNLSGAYSEHEHTASGSIQYDESYHWYNCATIGCGNLVNKAAHSGGTATCNAKAKCSTCGYAYGALSTTNHTGGTEIRNQSSTYTGDTYCLGCNAVLAKGSGTTPPTPPVTGSAHTPYKVGTNLMINNADSTDGWVASMFNTNIVAGAYKTEGNGSVSMNSNIPVGQDASIGAMTKVVFPATDLSTYSVIRYKVHFSHALSGTHQIQTNLITGDGGDGYNHVFTFTDFAAGWHTFEFKISDFAAAAPADLKSINAIRFTWFNLPQMNTKVEFIFDEIMAISAGAHAPYMVGSDLMINNADSTNGWIPDMFNTKIVAGAYKTEGNGSVSVNSTVPVGQGSSIGAMTKVVFPAANLTAFAKIRLKMHVSHPLNGTHQLQFNFITGDGGDGYNYTMTVADLAAGWHTITIDKASIAKAAEADWASINAIRFTWFNAQQISDKVEFIFDEIMALSAGAHAPYKVGEDLMINNADSVEGWEGHMHTNILPGTQILEGTGSVTMDPIYPYGQTASIGAMSKVIFPSTDLSSYKTIVYRYHISDELYGVHQIQTNFITGDGGDGFNYVITFDNMEPGWHTMMIDMASMQQAVPGADWTSINAIRFTWFNLEPIPTAVKFTFDEIMALKDEHVCSRRDNTVYYNDAEHWYVCAHEGCGLRVDVEEHYGGEATCISKAYCAHCVRVDYGEINPNNHVNTELLNVSDTYTGDLYCYDCEKTIKKGTAISKAEATVTVGTVKGSYKSGSKIAIPVTITEWSNSYAYITVSLPKYNASYLKFDGFSESATGFKGALIDYGSNVFVLIAAPTSSSAASKVKGGEVCVLNFTALKELTFPVAVSVDVEVNGYAYGAEDDWTTDRPLRVETKAGGTAFDDSVKPVVTIGSVSNDVANTQSVHLKFSDNGSIAGYYIGTSSNYLNNTFVATTATSATHSVNAAGKYYIHVVDASGNVSSAVNVTFYMITFNANGGTLSADKVLVKAGSVVALPTATKTGYNIAGWATSATATSGATSITANANGTYYAVWKATVYGDSTNDGVITSVDALYVLQAVVGTRTLTAEQIAYCDVNGDGVITSVDALHILQKAIGKRTSFDVEGK